MLLGGAVRAYARAQMPGRAVSGMWRALAVALCCSLVVEATIIAKTSVTECNNYGGTDLQNRKGEPCGSKLLIALTVQANEGKAQHLEAKVAKTTDVTTAQAKSIQLKQPVRVRINKSPVLINYRLFQVGYVNHMPYEVVKKRRGSRCRDDWYASRSQVACGFHEEDGHKIFDSQGFCCKCKRSKTFYRGTSINACYSSEVGHCLRLHDLNYYSFGFFPAQLLFNITIEIQTLAFTTKAGEPVWETASILDIGPHKTRAKSENFQIKAEYIADFYPSDFMDSNKLAHRYLLVPDIAKFKERVEEKGVEVGSDPVWSYITNASEWMAVPKHYFDFTGSTCNKIGVYYPAFRNQGAKCSSPVGSCLQSQPHQLWDEDKQKQKEGRKGRYMLHNFGKVQSTPHHQMTTDYQVNFVATKVRRSLIVVSMVADNLQVVVTESPARIIEAYVDAFEALSAEGHLTVIIQNIGSLTSTYQVFVSHCSAGVDLVPSQSLTLDPSISANLSFTLHSFHAVGRINHCEVELYNQNTELLDNMTVYFETMDTCFCHGYCGCSCGENTTECPPPPTYDKDDDLKYLDFDSGALKRVKEVAEFLKSNFGKIALGGWFMFLLIFLGMLKVVHMLITGQIDFPAITEPAKFATKIAAAFGETCGECCLRCCECCQRYSLCLCATTVATVTGTMDHTTAARDDFWLKRGWRKARQCDGMCSGAKEARRAHRKEMRINKRKGIKKETVWFQKPYTCTCMVKDTMPCLEICKGLFFFIYCPLLPVWWVVDFFWEYGKRKWRRHKRKKRYRARKAAMRAQEEQAFLMLDQYTRGKVERQIVDFDKALRARKEKEAKRENKRIAPTVADLSSDDSSDTSDADEAGGIDELVNPGCPVYFNYAYVLPQNTPKSLQTPGRSFSIKGQLTEKGDQYVFELGKYTKQVKEVVEGKPKPLKQPNLLTQAHFRRQVVSAAALKLVTLTPLFPCLNDT